MRKACSSERAFPFCETTLSNAAPFDQLTSAQRTALISILSGDSLGRTAALANVTGRTVRRWRRQPAFQAALAAARVDFFSACRTHVNASLAAAFQTLVFTAGYSGNKGDQLKAATFLLNRVAHTEMSAKPHQKIHNSKRNQSFRPKFRRTKPDIAGHQRTWADSRRTLPDPGGRPVDTRRTTEGQERDGAGRSQIASPL